MITTLPIIFKRIALCAIVFFTVQQAKGQTTTVNNNESKKYSITCNIGSMNVSGDVRSKSLFNQPIKARNTLGIAIGGRVKIYKNFLYGYASFLHGRAHGYNCGASMGYQNAGTNNPWVRHGYTKGVYYNYLTKLRVTHAGLAVSTNTNRTISANLSTGAAYLGYATWVDALNSRGALYENGFESIGRVHTGGSIASLINCNLDLKNLFDGEYETPAERINQDAEYTWTTAFVMSLGTTIKVSNSLSIQLSNQVFFTNQDLIDGQKWQERQAITQTSDNLNYLSIGLSYNF